MYFHLVWVSWAVVTNSEGLQSIYTCPTLVIPLFVYVSRIKAPNQYRHTHECKHSLRLLIKKKKQGPVPWASASHFCFFITESGYVVTNTQLYKSVIILGRSQSPPIINDYTESPPLHSATAGIPGNHYSVGLGTMVVYNW